MITKAVRFSSTRLFAAIVIAIFAAVSVMAWSLSSRFFLGQAKGKVIQKAFTRNEVVEFTEIKVSQNAIQPGKAFDADDDWVGKSKVQVKNIYDKPIIFLSVTFDFPETTKTGSVMSYPVSFGVRPDSKFPQANEPLFLVPGGTLEIPLDKDYAKIKKFVERRQQMTEIHKLELVVGFVIFADKTAWAAGNFYRQDPKDPDHYINTGDKPEPTQ